MLPVATDVKLDTRFQKPDWGKLSQIVPNELKRFVKGVTLLQAHVRRHIAKKRYNEMRNSG
jgi:hypothetical protein